MGIVTRPIIDLAAVSLTLTSRAGPVEILKGVDLAVLPGESIAVVGPSGSGKTSLLMVIAGLERATSGQVRVADRQFMALGEDDLAVIRGTSIGIVFQSFHLLAHRSVSENIMLADVYRRALDALGMESSTLDSNAVTNGLFRLASHLKK